MFRRRRPRREIEFSFDSFLDVVANVIGIILRLILVAWVGARAYKACVPPPPPRPLPALAEPQAPPEPYDPRVERFAAIRARIEQEAAARAAREKEAEAVRGAKQELASGLAAMEGQQARLRAAVEQARDAARRAAAGKQSTAELEARSRALLAELERLRKLPPRRKELRYHTPVSADVQEEVMFECRGGRVTLIDRDLLETKMYNEIRGRIDDLRRTGSLSGTTAAVGPFRLRFDVERVTGDLDGRLDGGWVLEPVQEQRGEGQEQALAAGSVFRRVADHLDPELKAVTLWVYPDSFPLYRALRDYLHGRNVVVAGRPLRQDAPIGSSSKGTVSRGQ